MRSASIPILLICHVVAGAVSAYFAADQPAISGVILIGIIFCQTSLLGMWAGLVSTHWLLRLIGLALGSIYLAYELAWGINDFDVPVFLLVILPCVLVAVVTWVVRLFKGTLRRVDGDRAESNEALQFSIRHLMALTFVVACLTAIGKIAVPSMNGLDILARIVVLALCYTAVALTSIWAMLGSGRPLPRSFFVVLIAVLAGVLADYTLENTSDFHFWLSTTALQAILLVGSLVVFRATGYRFVAKTAQHNGY